MKKLLICSLMFLFLFSSSVFSLHASSNLVWNITFSNNNDLEGSCDIITDIGVVNCSESESSLVVHKCLNLSTNSINHTFEMRAKFVHGAASAYFMYFHDENSTNAANHDWRITTASDGYMQLTGGTNVNIGGVKDDGTWHFLKFVNLLNDSVDVYVNDTYVANVPKLDSEESSWFLFKADTSVNFEVDWIAHYNTSEPTTYTSTIGCDTNDTHPRVILNFTENVDIETEIEDYMMLNYSNTKNISFDSCDLPKGLVEVNFKATGASDYKQKYVYINDQEIDLFQRIFVLTNPDVHRYYRILDVSHSIIRDADVYHYQINSSSTNRSYRLTNKDISDSEGYVDFWLESSYYNKIDVITDNFELDIPELEKYNSSNTESTADNLLLGILDNVTYVFSARLPSPIYSKSSVLKGTVSYTPGKTLKYHTQYMTSNRTASSQYTYGSGIIAHLLNNEYYVVLYPTTDFDTSDSNNITVSFYSDDTYITDVVIEYISVSFTGTADIGSLTFNRNILSGLLFIGLILVAGICRFIFRDIEVGKHVFLVGLIVLTAVSASFFLPAAVSIVYYILSIIKPLLGVQA